MFESKLLYRTKDGPKIIIIGAGVAGLAAASRLIRHGYNNIKIIEAEDRIGGRVHSVPLKDCTVDLGAHWVHGEKGNAVFELAHQLKLLNHSGDFTNVHFILSSERELDPTIGMSLFEESDIILNDEEALAKFDGSIYDYMMDRVKKHASQKIGGDILTAYMDWLVKFECSIEGCNSLAEPSAKGLMHYKRCEGDLLLDWKGNGAKTVINLLLGKHKDCEDSHVNLTDKLALNTEVEQIDYSGIGVAVKCKGGGIHLGDYAILSVSLGVLKDKHKTMFYPPLPPEKRKSIIGLSIGTINKVYLKFPYAWWPEGCSGFSLLWLKDDKEADKENTSWAQEIFGFYTESSSPTTLTAWLVGGAAMDMECYSTEQVKDSCYRILKKFLGFKYDIPEPEDVVRSSWYSNPHFRGSYSFRSLNSDALGTSASDLAKPLQNTVGKDVVFFAGEATHDYYYSTVHGAIETGWREADRIMYKDKLALKTQRLQSSL